MWYIIKAIFKPIFCLIGAFFFYLYAIIISLIEFILFFKIESTWFTINNSPKVLKCIEHEYGQPIFEIEYRCYYSFFHWYYQSNKCCKIQIENKIWPE